MKRICSVLCVIILILGLTSCNYVSKSKYEDIVTNNKEITAKHDALYAQVEKNKYVFALCGMLNDGSTGKICDDNSIQIISVLSEVTSTTINESYKNLLKNMDYIVLTSKNTGCENTYIKYVDKNGECVWEWLLVPNSKISKSSISIGYEYQTLVLAAIEEFNI